ncbi:MAG: sigma-70 family RNA polymerase sigma factor [Pirellulales bacterium]
MYTDYRVLRNQLGLIILDDLYDKMSDTELLKLWSSGQEAAATALVRRYSRRLHGLIVSQTSSALLSRMEVEDIAQSVFRLLFQSIQTKGYVLPEQTEMWGLLLVLALNKIRNRERELRAKKRSITRTNRGDFDWDQFAGHQDAAVTFLKLMLEEEIDHLPEAQQKIIHMRLEGYDLATIAGECHRSTRTVERVLQTFRGKLEGLV